MFLHYVKLQATESSDSASASSSSDIKSQEVMPPTETREEESTLHEANKENIANIVVNGSCQHDKEETICTEETKRFVF